MGWAGPPSLYTSSSLSAPSPSCCLLKRLGTRCPDLVHIHWETPLDTLQGHMQSPCRRHACQPAACQHALAHVALTLSTSAHSTDHPDCASATSAHSTEHTDWILRHLHTRPSTLTIPHITRPLCLGLFHRAEPDAAADPVHVPREQRAHEADAQHVHGECVCVRVRVSEKLQAGCLMGGSRGFRSELTSHVYRVRGDCVGMHLHFSLGINLSSGPTYWQHRGVAPHHILGQLLLHIALVFPQM